MQKWNKQKSGKRIVAVVLAMLLVLMSFPLSVFAAGASGDAVVFEAEDCELGVVTVNGTIVEGMHKAGAYVQLNNVDGGAEGGEFTFTINYSTGMPDVFKALYVNGEYVEDIEFLPTDNMLWQTYGDMEVTVSLKPGAENTIRIDNGPEENPYGLNFDYFIISPKDMGHDGERLVEYEAENGILGGGAKVSGNAVGDMHKIGAYCEIPGFDGGAEGGECWCGVYQDKKLVHNAQLKSGETRDYEVPYPFKVSVGNRAKGFVKVDGAPVDLNINNRATSTVFTLVQK